MKKSTKLLSGLLATLMATSCFTGAAVFSASADTDNDLGPQKVYFEYPSDGTWGDPSAVSVNKNGLAKVYCYVYSVYGNEHEFYDTGWETKATQCTWESGNIYSYDINNSMTVTKQELDEKGKPIKETHYRHLEEGADYGIIFSASNEGKSYQTVDVNMNYSCIGDTIILSTPTQTRENASNSQKSDYFAEWKNNKNMKIKANITSTGKFVEGEFAEHQPKAQMLSNSLKQYLTNPVNVGYFQLANNLKLCGKLGVEPIDVYNQYIKDNADIIANGVVENTDEAPVAFIRYMGHDTSYNPKEEKLAAPEVVAEVLGLSEEDINPPTTEPETTEPTTEATEPTTEATEPTTDPEPEDVYSIAGSSAALFGAGWDKDNTSTEMTKNDDGTYSITFVGAQPEKKIGFKVLKNHNWDTSWGKADGSNFVFNIDTVCDVTIAFDPATETITVTADPEYAISFPTFEVETMRAVGSGQGSFLNGIQWDPASDLNVMTEVAEGIYEITYEDVDSFGNYQVKFAANGDWTDNFGLAKDGSVQVVLGEAVAATYDGDDIVFEVEEDGSIVKLQLDLRNFDFATKEGATFTITVIPPEPETVLVGDVDGDGEVTIADATNIQMISIDLNVDIELTEDVLKACDVNNDGRISVLDATCVQKYVAKLEKGTGNAGVEISY